ncbi:hypothetical protein ACHAWF_004464, partial [Thalassiosira exigua]
VEELYESILDLIPRDDHGGMKAGTEASLELNAITVMPAPPPTDGTKLGKSSRLYDVHDGQQRLVTLCLVYAALRDVFVEWGEDWECDAQEMARAIYPKRPRLDNVARVQLKERKNSIMHHIQSNVLIGKGDDDDCDGTFSASYQWQGRYGAKERKLMSKPELRILETYEYLMERVKDLGQKRAEDFLVALKDQTFLLVCIPSSTRMARNFVMGLGKGKNLEPVDELKGLVCFNSIKDEQCQDETLKKWDDLCEEVSRDTTAAACLLTAQAVLQKSVVKNGEVDLFEDYLKIYLESQTANDGATFFENELLPAAKILQGLYDGTRVLGGSGSRPIPSLSFLCAAAQIRTSKDVETVLLHLLRLHEACETQAQRDNIECDLYKLEGIALWMMLAKPKPAIRRKHCFDIINMRMGDTSARKQVAQYYNPLALTAEEKQCILERLECGELGKGADSKIGKAVLERLNEHELITSTQAQVKNVQHRMQSTLQIEHILPQKYDKVAAWANHWDEELAGQWMHRLGNLALLNQKLNARISNGPFSEKREHYKLSPYPMTRRILDEYGERWAVDEVRDNHRHIIQPAATMWNLGYANLSLDDGF